ncbi:MAG: c-type cytochrome [Chloroflexota bacterium]
MAATAAAPAVTVIATLGATVAPTRQATPPAPAATAVAVAPAGGNVDNGRQLFQQNCNACHPNGDQGVGPTLHGVGFRGQFPDDASVVQIVANGRGGMPAFGSRLSPQQITDMVAYMRSLP